MNKGVIANLSNSFSAGGGGHEFERHVQAVFLLTLIVEGFSPVLEAPVKEIDFQTKRLGFDTDDLLVIAEDSVGEIKMLCQIKHDIDITERSVLFQTVINAAWGDFQNPQFRKGRDQIALITGFIAQNSIRALRQLHNMAIHALNAAEFLTMVRQANFVSKNVREKFAVIEKCLRAANGDSMPSEGDVWRFCQSYVLLVFDLDYESSVNRMLVRSLIRCNSPEDAGLVWSRLGDYAGECNQAAARVVRTSIREDIITLFKNRMTVQPSSPVLHEFVFDEFWAGLALAGGWDETNSCDRDAMEKIMEMPYRQLESKARLLLKGSAAADYLELKDGIWRVKRQRELVRQCGPYYFDSMIRAAFACGKVIFSQRSRRFSEQGEYDAFMPAGRDFASSDVLREGLMRGLCIAANGGAGENGVMCHCSPVVMEREAAGLVAGVLCSCDFVGWAGLGRLLPLLAEISPVYYLRVLEEAILEKPDEMERLFPKSADNPLFAPNFISSVLWSLEILAWSEKYLVSCVRCLGELAQLKQEKTNYAHSDYANTPIRSIVSLLLPWYPQTMASAERRKNAIQALQKEAPAVGWEVLKQLMPGAVTTTSENPKPQYFLQVDEQKEIPSKAILEMQRYYVDLAVEAAAEDSEKLAQLGVFWNFMDGETAQTFLERISIAGRAWGEEARCRMWIQLNDCRYRAARELQRNNSEPSPTYELLCDVIKKLEPLDIRLRYRRLYLSSFDEFSFDGWREKEKKKTEEIEEIYKKYGIDGVVDMAGKIEASGKAIRIAAGSRYDIARKAGMCIPKEDLADILANCYSGDLDVDFVINILDGFVMIHGISALPAAELERYPGDFAAQLLAPLPFSAELFHMVEQLLPGQEALYWQSAAVPYIYSETDPYELKYVVEKLMEYERYAAVVNLLGRSVADYSADWLVCKGVEEETLYRALIMAGTTESSADTLDSYAAKNLIKKLQQRDEPEREQLELLSQIEFIYLPWLDECTLEHTRALYVKLANDPDSFCRIIEVYYRRRHEKEAGAEEQKKQRVQKQLPPNISRRLSQIILRFAVIPGTDWNGNFHEDVFESWMEYVKAWSRENDRYEVAMSIVGSGLSYFRTSTCEGLLPDELIMRTLDAADGVYLRRGYESGTVNQRGAHWMAPSGEPEIRLAETYERMADQAEALGYSRYAEVLREVASHTMRAMNLRQM